MINVAVALPARFAEVPAVTRSSMSRLEKPFSISDIDSSYSLVIAVGWLRLG
jgi:hypothetical protein